MRTTWPAATPEVHWPQATSWASSTYSCSCARYNQTIAPMFPSPCNLSRWYMCCHLCLHTHLFAAMHALYITSHISPRDDKFMFYMFDEVLIDPCVSGWPLQVCNNFDLFEGRPITAYHRLLSHMWCRVRLDSSPSLCINSANYRCAITQTSLRVVPSSAPLTSCSPSATTGLLPCLLLSSPACGNTQFCQG